MNQPLLAEMPARAYLELNHVKSALRHRSRHSIHAAYWLEVIKEAREETAVSFYDWLKGKETLKLLQVTVNNVLEFWASAGPQVVNRRKTYMTFDGARRDYAELAHLFHSDDTYIAVASSGEALQICIYTIPMYEGASTWQ